MPSTIVLKALGLNISPNQLDVPEGSLVEAKNIIIKRDNVVESRRGFKLYGDSFGGSSDIAKQLIIYKSRILRHYSTKLEFDDGSGNFSEFNGDYTEQEPGLRIKSIESNGNLYFTTSEGVKKISAKSSADLSTNSNFITQSGGIKAIDLTANLNISLGNQSGFLSQDGAVAYRAVWGIKDLNNNIVLGSPSARSEVYNPLQTLLLRDYMRVLGALDDINQSGSLITDGNYVSTLKLDVNTTAVQIRNNMIAMATKIDNDILYADNDGAPTGAPLEIGSVAIALGVCTITFASGTATDYFTVGSKMYLTGFTPTTGTLDGAQVVTNATATTIDFNTSATGPVTIGLSTTIVSNEYRSITQPTSPSIPPTNNQLEAIQTYLDNIIIQLQSEPNAVISSTLRTGYIDVLNITTSGGVILDVTIPEDITLNHFLQLYRSSVALADGAATIEDITPDDELQLVYEAYPTQAELDLGIMTVEDITPDSFRGANLYTNPATGEGILQSNDIPPYCKDIAKFKGYTFFLNTKTKHRKVLSLLGVTNMISDYNGGTTPQLVITNNTTSNTYDFIVGVQEQTDITCVADVADSLNGTYFLVNSADNKRKYYVWYKTSGGSTSDPTISGRTGIRVDINTGETANGVASKTSNVIARYVTDFDSSATLSVLTITNTDYGYTDDVDAGTTGFSISIINDGRGERTERETSEVTCVADVAGSLAGTYFTLNTAFNRDEYYIWYKVSGVGTDPLVANKIGIQVDITTNDSATNVATATKNTLNNLTNKFICSNVSSLLTIINYNYGPAINSTAGTSGFTVNTIQEGALEILLSDVSSPAQAVDTTARSLVSTINKNKTDSVYGYYLSGPQDVPGRILLESRVFDDNEFYILGNNDTIGTSFNPSITPSINILSISTGSPTSMLITTTTDHGLINQDEVIIVGSDSVPSIDGKYQITYVSPTTFRIPLTITSSGTIGSLIKAFDSEFSENETKPNRVYYSKLQQPEAVPILNYFDVGAEDKEGLRLFPLRDSLFVFKEDGLYRISGEFAPFLVGLFDSSCVLIAPDSVSLSNNLIYSWTTQGIVTVSEAGVNIISRPIDIDILKLSSSSYTNFKTATWGVGYESDNSYTAWTINKTTDEIAQVGYRFSNLTNSWTTVERSNTCGVINSVDDKLYLGSGITNFIEQERKNFSRTDYSDWEYDDSISSGHLDGKTLILSNVSNYSIGDVLKQEQTLSIYEFNLLLKKLDIDPGIPSSDYYSTLVASSGNNLRTKLQDLATKLDSDSLGFTDYFDSIDIKSGVISLITADNPTEITSAAHELQNNRIITITGSDSTPSIDDTFAVTVTGVNTFTVNKSVTIPGTTGSWTTEINNFNDIKACYNTLIGKLNSDSVVSFSNYGENDTTTELESVIVGVNKSTNTLTLDNSLEYIQGDIKIFKAISCSFIYAPNHFGDPLGLKHLREATVMFQNKAFTSSTLSFSTDLLPQFIDIGFNGDGNGIFGMGLFGSGFFGGASHSAPFRTYVPRQCQRCRFILVKFNHKIAREEFALYGITITGEISQSTRAYR